MVMIWCHDITPDVIEGVIDDIMVPRYSNYCIKKLEKGEIFRKWSEIFENRQKLRFTMRSLARHRIVKVLNKIALHSLHGVLLAACAVVLLILGGFSDFCFESVPLLPKTNN